MKPDKREFLWTEKYRPKSLNDIVLPKKVKSQFRQYIKQNNLPNLLLSGTPGIGKTTVAKALCEEMGIDYIFINASKDGNIDTLRTTVQNFASTLSLEGNGRKCVIMDESDSMNPTSTMPAFRSFMEEYSKNCAFIFTCNYPEKIIAPLRSRFTEIFFTIPKEEKKNLIISFIEMVEYILGKETVEYDKKVIASFVVKQFPDMRKCLTELQSYAIDGTIDTGILSSYKNLKAEEIFKILKAMKFNDMRKWVAETEPSFSDVIHLINSSMDEYIEETAFPQTILLLNQYQYNDYFAINKTTNIIAFFTEMMADIKFR